MRVRDSEGATDLVWLVDDRREGPYKDLNSSLDPSMREDAGEEKVFGGVVTEDPRILKNHK